MKYICLGYYESAKHEAMTEGEQRAMFDESFEYDDHLRANGHWAGGQRIPPATPQCSRIEAMKSRARGSSDCPSQKIASLRTTGLRFLRA